MGRLDVDFRKITTIAHLWTIFVPAAQRSPDTQNADLETLRDGNCLHAIHLKVTRDRHLEIFLTAFKTQKLRLQSAPMINLFLVSIEILLIKFLIACTIALTLEAHLNYHLLKRDTTVYLNWTFLKTESGLMSTEQSTGPNLGCETSRDVWEEGTVGVQSESLQDVSLWDADCFELKATLATGSEEASSPYP